MPKRLIRSLGVVLSAGALVVACNSDITPVAPPAATSVPTASSSGLLGGLLGGVVGTVTGLLNLVVGVITRPAPLPSDVTWSFVATPLGARSSNSTVGLSIYVPPGAVSQNVTITVTARQGSVFDYHFEPEGLQFAVPVVLTQNVPSSLLWNSGSSIKGAYYSAPELQYDPSTGQAVVNELQPTAVNPWIGQVNFTIKHFSGYILASSNSSGSFSSGW